ncbi:hypothetical protein CH278_06065 [Rhodococcus sp. 05-2254-5]|nr:hypothetical protein CH278_06065 [Rhodococcus sp. 05-2254-5]OZE54458.1 hypothetical protein CH269_16850 [Rhodococcus sp. 05-2254-1]
MVVCISFSSSGPSESASDVGGSMQTVFWAPRFAAVYFLAALASLVLFTTIGANMAIAAPLILALVGMGIAVLIRSRTGSSVTRS